MKKNLVIALIIFICINSILSYVFIKRYNVLEKNKDDNSFFHANQKIGYAEGLTNETFYHKNDKELIKKLFFGCSLLDYDYIKFDEQISIKVTSGYNTFHDNFVFLHFQ